MAGYEELDKFVKKFVSLWQAGCDANLSVEANAGNASVSLKVSLGKAKYHSGNRVDARGCLAGSPSSPSRQRRRERRSAAREAQATTEEVVAKEGSDGETATEQVGQNVQDSVEETKVSSDVLEYELKVEAHEDCRNYSIIEAIEVNFDGTLDDMKVDKCDGSRYIVVQKENKREKVEKLEHDRNVLLYKVVIKNCESSRSVIESWTDRYKFDDLAFNGAVRDKINVRIREVQKL